MKNRSSRILLLGFIALATGACGEDEVLHELHAVTHGEGRFVAVGYQSPEGADYQPLLMSSADGRSWSRHDASIPQQALHDVAFGNGVFVAVGGNLSTTATGTSIPVVLSSDDGVTWTSRNLSTTEPIRRVAFGGGIFVIIDNAGQTFVSTDGRTFTPGGAIPDGFDISGITSGAGQFVFWGFHSGVYVSADASTFTEHPLDVDDVSCLHFINDQFRGVGQIGHGEDNPMLDKSIVTSATGETWAKESGSFPCNGLAESNGVFVAGSGLQLYRSDDLQTFTPTHTAEERHDRIDVAAGGGVFVAVGWNEIDTSSDGLTWTVTPIP